LLSAAKTPEAGGPPQFTDWFKKEKSDPRGDQEFIHTTRKGHLVELQSMHDYERFLTSNGLQIMHREI